MDTSQNEPSHISTHFHTRNKVAQRVSVRVIIKGIVLQQGLNDRSWEARHDFRIGLKITARERMAYIPTPTDAQLATLRDGSQDISSTAQHCTALQSACTLKNTGDCHFQHCTVPAYHGRFIPERHFTDIISLLKRGANCVPN